MGQRKVSDSQKTEMLQSISFQKGEEDPTLNRSSKLGVKVLTQNWSYRFFLLCVGYSSVCKFITNYNKSNILKIIIGKA